MPILAFLPNMLQSPFDYRESDPIFAADRRAQAYDEKALQEGRPRSFNLTTGTIFNEAGEPWLPTPSVAAAEAMRNDGDNIFNASYSAKGKELLHLGELALPFLHSDEPRGPTSYFSAEGGSGAMVHILNFLKDKRMPYVKRQKIADATKLPVVMTTPKWPNHPVILHGHGYHTLREVPHLANNGTDFNIQGVISMLRKSGQSILLLQTAPHNPTGKSPTDEHWNAIGDEAEKNGHIVLLDSSFPGLAQNVIADMKPSRILAQKGVEHFNAISLSKIFGIPAWRTGLACHVHPADEKPDGKIMEHDTHAIRTLGEWQMRNADSSGTYIISHALEHHAGLMHAELETVCRRINRKTSLVMDGLPEFHRELDHEGQFVYLKKVPVSQALGLEQEGVFLAPVQQWRDTVGLRVNLGRLPEIRIPEFIEKIRSICGEHLSRKKRPA